MSNSADARNSVATAATAADSGSDIDDADAVQSVIEADLLESVHVCLSYRRKIPRRGASKSEKGHKKESCKL